MCVKRSTNNVSLYGELGRVPLIVIRNCNMIRYWIKIIKLANENLIKKVYNMLKNDANIGISYNGLNWAYHVKALLESLGFCNLWTQQEFVVINYKCIKQRIYDQYYQSWYSNINNSDRLLSYCMFKHEFLLEKYLECIMDKRLRIALCKFRVSSHDLEIECGRYTRIARNDRCCKICKSSFIENEYHFLLICPAYANLRKQYLAKYYYTWPNIHKFSRLMMSQNKNELIKLSKFIFHASTLRLSLIN